MTTPRREQIYDFIRWAIERRGIAPTNDEIGRNFDMTAVGAWKHVQELIAEGRLVHKGRGKARSIDLPGRVDLSSVRTDRLQAELARRRAVSHAEASR